MNGNGTNLNRQSLVWVCVSFWMVFFFSSCSTQPVPLEYGTDTCYSCKMTLVDNKFGAELVTNKGKIYRFDDINCFLSFYHSGHEPVENFEHKLVIDYANPGVLIDAAYAFYVKAPGIRSPMNSQVAAFGTQPDMDEIMKKSKGIYMAWGEVITQFK